MFDSKFTNGFLAHVNLKKHMLIDSEEPEINPSKWLVTNSLIKEYGEKPAVIVVNVDPLENYYRILLGEKYYWFPIEYTEIF